VSAGGQLVVDGATKRYGGVQALDDVTIAADPGAITGLIGPNGAGKTTLFDIITGYARPDSGRITYGGQRLTGLSPQRISRLGVVRTFQDVRVFRHLTVLENIAVASRSRADLDRACDFLKTVYALTANPMPLNIAAGGLRFGNQKIVGLARCIATGATALLLDEPAAALHDSGRDVIASLMAAFRESGGLVLVVEHDMRFVMSTCDRVFVLAQGRLLASGPPEAIQANSQVIDAYRGKRPVTAPPLGPQ